MSEPMEEKAEANIDTRRLLMLCEALSGLADELDVSVLEMIASLRILQWEAWEALRNGNPVGEEVTAKDWQTIEAAVDAMMKRSKPERKEAKLP